MPDFNNSRAIDGIPNGWSEAFCGLPLEAPPTDGWTRIVRALDAPASRAGAVHRERRANWLIGLASAAVLVVAVWSPLSRWLQNDPAEAHPAVVTTEAPGLRGPAAPVRNEPPASETATVAVAGGPVAASEVSPAPAKPMRRKPVRSVKAVARQSRDEAISVPAVAPQPALGAAEPSTDDKIAVTSGEIDSLQKLKTQSAQLEALVALARDERVANASSELLSSELDANIAALDAALSQPDLTDIRKQELWQRRVDLLQQLAGIEATSRWLAAQGAFNETTLVSVY